MRRMVATALFLLGAGTLLQAQFPVPTQRQLEDQGPPQMRELVSRYCRLDYEGSRLDPKAWSKFQPLVWWREAPKYSQIDVVARYIVDPEPAARNNKYVVSVHYRLLGTYDLANGYVPEPEGSMQNVDFVVSPENTDYRIADAENTFPHPSRAAMLKWLNEQLASEQNAAVKERLQRAVTLLSAQSASPFAK
ncbi:MAG TPA: hypothetical protein VFB04_16955 [Terriglobales bacterium]|nr:hypothetical protein [Terriglobales bacterium]